MEVEVAQVAAGLIGQLLDGADAVAVLAIGALPDRQRRAPVALAAEGPVDVVLKPVAEAAFADVVGHPVDGVIELDEAILELAGADVPGVRGRSTSRACGSASRTGRCECSLPGGRAGRGHAGLR